VTITVRLEPEVETRLSARARAQGMSLDAYVRTVIEQIAVAEGPPQVALEEFEAGLDALAEGSEQLPVLPPEAYRRESIYGEP
jgi:predicted transcriptional regulator